MRLTSTLLAASLALATAGTLAQPAAPAKPAPKAAAPAAAPTQGAKPAPKQATPKPATPKQAGRKPAAKPLPPPPPPLAEANEEQLAAAKQAYLGVYECEFKQSVLISPHSKVEGYIDVAWQKQVFVMKPVLSSTGALRLEDVTGRTLMVQIANKSMLLDVKVGQRLVDECIHPEQRAAIEAAKSASAPEPGSGLGISAPGTH